MSISSYPSSIFRFPLLMDDAIRKIQPKQPRNPTFIGVCHYNWKITNDPKYLKLAIKNGSIQALEKLATYYEDNQQLNLAKKYYCHAITYGCVKSMIKLALIYRKENDISKSIEYFKLAYNFGNKQSLLMLSSIDNKNAEKYLKLAVTDNVETAKFQLGHLYEERNEPEKAIAQYQSAINSDENDTVAMFSLAQLYEETEQYDKLIELHEKNIEQTNSRDSMVALGDFYNSDSDFYDKELSIKWYESASKLGKTPIPLLMHYLSTNDDLNLKNHYLNVDGELRKETMGRILNRIANYEHVEGNQTECDKLHEQAIEYGNADSMYDYARINLKNGNGTNYVKYFELAINNGNQNAIKNVDEYNDYQYNSYKKVYEANQQPIKSNNKINSIMKNENNAIC